ncbi:hypothetical protein BCR44DRAFT_1438178, partial [Catenaria anguillulae PL171]
MSWPWNAKSSRHSTLTWRRSRLPLPCLSSCLPMWTWPSNCVRSSCRAGSRPPFHRQRLQARVRRPWQHRLRPAEHPCSCRLAQVLGRLLRPRHRPAWCRHR